MARVLIIDDDADFRAGLAETLADLGHQPIEASRAIEGLRRLDDHPDIDAVLVDLRMPDMDGIAFLRAAAERSSAPPIAMLTAFASGANTIAAMRHGAFDHLLKPVTRAAVAALIERMVARGRAGAETRPSPTASDPLIGVGEAMRSVQKTIGLVADGDSTVLITGETGTGKELVARALHDFGGRAKKPFVAVNCAAIPTELLESTLFGHVRGAFTGAVADRRGSFREAAGGTLFLDEIGDMDLAMQAKILRVLEDRVVVPVGGRAEPIDVRVVAATHRDLARRAASGDFRADLYYRLAVVPIQLPPLHERLADIIPLAEHFLARAPKARRLTAAAAARLMAHPWPGNVRELRNAIERASALVRGEVIDVEDFGFLAPAPTGAARRDEVAATGDVADDNLEAAIQRLEAVMIRRVLAAAGGNRAEAARRLGIHRQLLYAKLKKLGLDES